MLTSEQQRFWDCLRGPEFHCHEMAKDILSIRGRAKRFHARIDQHLETVMKLYSGDEVIRILHTWLSIYKMPIHPGELACYDRFHARYGSTITAGIGHIKPY